MILQSRCLLMPFIPIPIRPLSPHKPVHQQNHHHYRIHDTDIIHVPRIDGHLRREAVHDKGKDRPDQKHPIGYQAHGTHPEGAMLDIVAAFDEEADDGNGVGDVEKHNAGGYHGVEGGCGADIQATQDGDDDAGDEMSIKWDVECGVDCGEPAGGRETAVTREGPAESRLPRVTRNLASHARDDDHGF